MRYLIFLAAVLCAGSAHAESTPVSQIKALMDYCVPPIESGTNPAEYAISKKLPAFPAEQAIKFAPEGGKVFEIPTDIGNALLITNKEYDGMCGVAIRETNANDFWTLAHETFNKKSGFTMRHEKREEALRITRKDFVKDTLHGQMELFISVSDKPQDGGMQALVTLARVKPKPKP